MTTAVRIHPARPQGRLTPQQRRRVPSLGPRPRVAVLARRGPASLGADDVRRVARLADVTFHAVAEAPDLDTATRLLRRVDVLAVTASCLPVLDAALLERTPQLRAIVLVGGGHDAIDLELLEDYGVGLDVVPCVRSRAGKAAALQAAWGAHLVAALEDRPRNPVIWPSLLYPEAI